MPVNVFFKLSCFSPSTLVECSKRCGSILVEGCSYVELRWDKSYLCGQLDVARKEWIIGSWKFKRCVLMKCGWFGHNGCSGSVGRETIERESIALMCTCQQVPIKIPRNIWRKWRNLKNLAMHFSISLWKIADHTTFVMSKHLTKLERKNHKTLPKRLKKPNILDVLDVPQVIEESMINDNSKRRH